MSSAGCEAATVLCAEEEKHTEHSRGHGYEWYSMCQYNFFISGMKRRLHGKAYYKSYVSLHITTILDVTSATQLPQYIRLFMYSQIYNQSINQSN